MRFVCGALLLMAGAALLGGAIGMYVVGSVWPGVGGFAAAGGLILLTTIADDMAERERDD